MGVIQVHRLVKLAGGGIVVDDLQILALWPGGAAFVFALGEFFPFDLICQVIDQHGRE